MTEPYIICTYVVYTNILFIVFIDVLSTYTGLYMIAELDIIEVVPHLPNFRFQEDFSQRISGPIPRG